MVMDIFRVQVINRHRLLTDGEGVTTLVGLYACPLHCKYCINKDVLNKSKFMVMSPEQLWERVKIDYCYFLSTGGGLTFGGGESLIYSEPIIKFMDILPEGVLVNLETSLNYDTPFFDEIIKRVDSLIIDIKSLDDGIYQEYTGKSSKFMKENLKKILDSGYKDKCTLRVPVIPEFVDEQEAGKEKETLHSMGFPNVEVFPYIIRDYM